MTEPPKKATAQRDPASTEEPPEQVKAERSEAPEEPAAPNPQPEQITDGVLVPLDTWTRVMEQLGNLHEAGQELAEARERAARAETQVEFLREQLAAERTKTERRERKQTAAATPAPEPEPAPTPAIDLTAQRARVAAARDRVSGWLATRR